jgi:GTPase SAR1 family protein
MNSSSLEASSINCKNKYKIVFLGDMSVGKSSIIERFMKGCFNEKHNVHSFVNEAYCRH